jgi:hypothetical protein
VCEGFNKAQARCGFSMATGLGPEGRRCAGTTVALLEVVRLGRVGHRQTDGCTVVPCGRVNL